MHVRGKYCIYIFQQQTATAVIIVLQLAAGFVCCLLHHAIYGSVDSSVLLRLGPNLHTYSSNSCVVQGLAVGTSRAACAAAAACYTARCYCILLAVRKRVRCAAACYTYFRATRCRLLLAVVIPNEM